MLSGRSLLPPGFLPAAGTGCGAGAGAGAGWGPQLHDPVGGRRWDVWLHHSYAGHHPLLGDKEAAAGWQVLVLPGLLRGRPLCLGGGALALKRPVLAQPIGGPLALELEHVGGRPPWGLGFCPGAGLHCVGGDATHSLQGRGLGAIDGDGTRDLRGQEAGAQMLWAAASRTRVGARGVKRVIDLTLELLCLPEGEEG